MSDSKIIIPDQVQDRIDSEDRQIRVKSLELAVESINSSVQAWSADDVVGIAKTYAAYIKG